MSGKITLQQTNRFLLFAIMTGVVLYFGKPVLIPLTFSIFFATLFTRLSNKMETKGLKRIYSALSSILILVVIVTGILWLVVWQAKKLADDLPEIEKRSQEFVQ